MDNAYLTSTLLKTSVEDIFFLVYIYFSNIDLLGFISCPILLISMELWTSFQELLLWYT